MRITYSKFRYYLLFFYYKLRIFADCKSGRGRLHLIFHTNFSVPEPEAIHRLETIFGKYRFINDYYGYSILSPAFERQDKELLISDIKQSIDQGKSVLFLDIGAYVGDYSIGISRRIQILGLTTLAFEPDIDYFRLCLENMRMNKMTNYKVYNVGLSDQKTAIKTLRFPSIPSSKPLTYRLQALDSIVPASFYKKFDEIFVKIDIEGHEKETFEGAKNLTKSGKKIRLMIEDCVNPSIIQYLSRHKWQFTKKITPYDSFWELN
jgi:FkbM family methyltransferase